MESVPSFRLPKDRLHFPFTQIGLLFLGELVQLITEGLGLPVSFVVRRK